MMWLISFQALSQTISADLTGDGVDDELRIGERSIIIIDGAQGKRYIPLKDTRIYDYRLIPFNEYYMLAVISSDGVVLTGFSDGDFRVLDFYRPNPYEEFINPKFAILEDRCSRKNMLAVIKEEHYIPQLLLSENLKFIAPDYGDYDEMYLSAGESKYIAPLVKKGGSLFLEVVVESYDIRLRVDAGSCGIFDVGRVSYYSGFFYNGEDHDERFRISFDNTYSIFTSKNVRYIIVKFNLPPYLFESYR